MAAALPDASLIAAVRTALLTLARDGRAATYQELVELAAAPPPHRIHKVTLALEALIREDHAAGRPLLAAFAVSRSRGGLPGRGFFELLHELGRADGPDDAADYQRELAAAKGFLARVVATVRMSWTGAPETA